MLSCRERRAGLLAFAMVVLMLVAGAGCDGDGDGGTIVGSLPPYNLIFSLDASFQAPHAGDPVALAVVRSSDGVVVAQGSGTISATQDPTYSFAAVDILEAGLAYEVHYWIDSNFGGRGTLGVCDPKDIDHQWSVEFPVATNNIDMTVSHQPALTEDVCGTFP